jgi:hypothetical protein
MNQKACVHLEIIKDDKSYTLVVPFGSTYQDTYDACIEIANKVVELSKEAQELAEKQKAEAEANQAEEPQGV